MGDQGLYVPTGDVQASSPLSIIQDEDLDSTPDHARAPSTRPGTANHPHSPLTRPCSLSTQPGTFKRPGSPSTQPGTPKRHANFSTGAENMYSLSSRTLAKRKASPGPEGEEVIVYARPAFRWWGLVPVLGDKTNTADASAIAGQHTRVDPAWTGEPEAEARGAVDDDAASAELRRAQHAGTAQEVHKPRDVQDWQRVFPGLRKPPQLTWHPGQVYTTPEGPEAPPTRARRSSTRILTGALPDWMCWTQSSLARVRTGMKQLDDGLGAFQVLSEELLGLMQAQQGVSFEARARECIMYICCGGTIAPKSSGMLAEATQGGRGLKCSERRWEG
ncbi:hypothetical protein FB451DRAFT_1176469 [Mycena latifolia]|nr:hypothetical protein FB451DRAFT_1176469 [Mycena latifolia]